jgi:hypothetical protein
MATMACFQAQGKKLGDWQAHPSLEDNEKIQVWEQIEKSLVRLQR